MSKPTCFQAALWRYRGSLNKKYATEFSPRPNLRYLHLDAEGNVVTDDMSKVAWIVELSFKNIIMGSSIYRVHRYSEDCITVIPPCKKRSYEFIFIVGVCYTLASELGNAK